MENAYTCLVVFLKERMLQSCRYTIDIHKTLVYVYIMSSQQSVLGDGNIAIPHRKFWRGSIPFTPMVDAYAPPHLGEVENTPVNSGTTKPHAVFSAHMTIWYRQRYRAAIPMQRLPLPSIRYAMTMRYINLLFTYLQGLQLLGLGLRVRVIFRVVVTLMANRPNYYITQTSNYHPFPAFQFQCK